MYGWQRAAILVALAGIHEVRVNGTPKITQEGTDTPTFSFDRFENFYESTSRSFNYSTTIPNEFDRVLHVASWGRPFLPPEVVIPSTEEQLKLYANRPVSSSEIPEEAKRWLFDGTGKSRPLTYLDYVEPKDEENFGPYFDEFKASIRSRLDYDECISDGMRLPEEKGLLYFEKKTLEETSQLKMDIVRGKGHPLCRLGWFGAFKDGSKVLVDRYYWIRAEWIRVLLFIDEAFCDAFFRSSDSNMRQHVVIVTGQPGIGTFINFHPNVLQY